VRKYKQNIRKGYHLILMDLNMPIMGGAEAVQRIRKLEKNNNIRENAKIIALTAEAAEISSENKQQYFEIGFNEICEKPVPHKIFCTLIEDINF